MASSPRERLHPTRHPIPVFGRRSWSSIAHAWIGAFLALVGVLFALALGMGLLRMIVDGRLPSTIDANWHSPDGADFPEDATEMLHAHGNGEVSVRVRVADAPILAILWITRAIIAAGAIGCLLFALFQISSGFASTLVFSRSGGKWLRRFAVLFVSTPALRFLTRGTIARLEESYVKSLDFGQEVSLYVSRAGGPGDAFFGIPFALVEFLFWFLGGIFFFLLGTALIRAANAEQMARETV